MICKIYSKLFIPNLKKYKKLLSTLSSTGTKTYKFLEFFFKNYKISTSNKTILEVTNKFQDYYLD